MARFLRILFGILFLCLGIVTLGIGILSLLIYSAVSKIGDLSFNDPALAQQFSLPNFLSLLFILIIQRLAVSIGIQSILGASLLIGIIAIAVSVLFFAICVRLLILNPSPKDVRLARIYLKTAEAEQKRAPATIKASTSGRRTGESRSQGPTFGSAPIAAMKRPSPARKPARTAIKPRPRRG